MATETIRMKKCSSCEEEKPENDFWRNKAHKDGLQNTCKSCNNKMRSKYNLKNKNLVNKRRRENYKKSKDKQRAATKKWKTKRPEYYKEYYEKNRDKVNDYDSRYSGILKKMGFENPPEELIQLKRTQIKIIRLCKIKK